MTKGWYGNGQKHALASRGIKSTSKASGSDRFRIKYNDGYEAEGKIVFVTKDLDSNLAEAYSYDNSEKLINYAQEIYNEMNEDNIVDENRPKTLKDAIGYLREFNILVSVAFDGGIITPQGEVIALNKED